MTLLSFDIQVMVFFEVIISITVSMPTKRLTLVDHYKSAIEYSRICYTIMWHLELHCSSVELQAKRA